MKSYQKAVSFLPSTLLSWIDAGSTEHRFQAVVAFADVSGFTKMSEQLAATGREGAETLTGILNGYFTEMINPIEKAGGFVGKFGGDAMTIFFPVEKDEKTEDVARRAISTSLDLQRKMKDFSNVKTRAGVFSLGMKIGIATGSVLYKVVGPMLDGGREYLLAGLPLDRAAEAEHHGVSGQVIVTPEVAVYCGRNGTTLEDGFVRFDTTCESFPVELKESTISTDPKWVKIARHFIDPVVYHRMALGMDSVGEIRRVSVIFMSFTGLDYEVDESVGKKLEEIYDWVYSLTNQYGGSINKVDMGDKGSKMIITFGTPAAHENDEELAVHCGLELVSGHEKNRKLGIEQRIGIATGVVFAGEVGAPSRQEYTVMGSVVNLAARQMAYSKPGQLIVDQNTRDRALKSFVYSDPVHVQFKGIKDPIPTYCVTGLKSGSARVVDENRKPLIGREEAYSTAISVMDEVIENKLKILILRGDAGIGKSRLIHELISLARARHFEIGAGESLSYAKRSPYLVWISILRKLMGLPPAGGGEKALQTLDKLVKAADPDNDFRLPIIAGLLGIQCPDNDITKHFDAQLRVENLFDFLVQVLKYLTRKSPVLLIFEDSQWIDKNSLSLIAYLIRNLADYPILFVTARRSYSRKFTSPHIAEIEKNPVTTVIPLSDLDRDQTEKLTLQVLDATAIDKDLMCFIYDSSHGNASFTEQLLENLKSIEKIRLVPDSEGKGIRVEKTGDLSDVEVPDSLSSLIMSQLDRLQPEAKLTVKLAASIGRQFQEEIVSGSYPVDMTVEQIRASIKELEIKDIVVEEQQNDILEYAFKNLLTLDVAYDSLLFAHRREYHKRIGVCLENLRSDSLSEWYEELARHFSQTDDDEKAVKYLGKSGDKAFDIYANDSAEDYYSRALERTDAEKNPGERFQLLSMRSKVYSIKGKNQLQEADLDDMLVIATNKLTSNKRIDVLANLASYYSRVRRLDEMKKTLDAAYAELAKVDYPFGTIKVNITMGEYFYYTNNSEEALKFWQQSNADAEKYNDAKGLSVALSNCGLAYKALGDFDKALEYYERSLKNDHKSGNKKSEAVNLVNIGVLNTQRGAYDKALEMNQSALGIAKSIGSKTLQARVIGNLAVLYQIRGERERALSTYNEHLEISKQIGFFQGQVSSLKNLGTWYLEYGDFEKALSFYEQSLTIIRAHGLKGQEPGTMLNIGLTQHYQGKLDIARKMLEQAVEASQAIKHKLSEDYARRYLGFVLIDLGELENAKAQFLICKDIAEAMRSKASVASAKVGLGAIEMIQKDLRETLKEGIEESRVLGDTETYVKGNILLARTLINKGNTNKEVKDILDVAFEAADSSGLRNDVEIVKSLLTQLT